MEEREMRSRKLIIVVLSAIVNISTIASASLEESAELRMVTNNLQVSKVDMSIQPTIVLDDLIWKNKNPQFLDIPNGVERILRRKTNLLRPITRVETIRIPLSVKFIEAGAFGNVSKQRLRRIETVPGSPYVVTNGCLIDTRDSAIVFALSGKTQIVVPETVRSILDYAFAGNDVVEVKLAIGLEKIGSEAFAHCSSLERINIPSAVNRIGPGAFSFCGKLRKIDVSAENKRFRVSDVFLVDSETDRVLRAFGDDDIVEIPMGIHLIGECAFTSMDSLEVVKIPDSVELVGEHAFKNCKNLIRIQIPREELRSQIVEEIPDYRSYVNNGERKTRLGVAGSPKLLPSQILVVGSSGAVADSDKNCANQKIDRTICRQTAVKKTTNQRKENKE